VHPPIEPFASGILTRSDGQHVYWETSGNPRGEPAVYLHGGPGGGLGPGGYRRRFDPERYLIVGVEQRGCGRSTPLASDDPSTLDRNTTRALLDDLEAVRTHLDVEGWLVHGVSWGTTLALAYALAHPPRVTALVLTAVTTTSREEVQWITEDIGRVFPEAWATFAADVPAGTRVVEHYARLLRDPDPAVRAVAADAWDRWESTHMSLGSDRPAGPLHADPVQRLTFATLVTHYWAHDGFLSPPILERAHELAGIPGVLIHGRLDVSGPAATAWMLHRAWPGSTLEIVEDEGHGGPIMMAATAAAIDALPRR
jgi:proline iminopeptidase